MSSDHKGSASGRSAKRMSHPREAASIAIGRLSLLKTERLSDERLAGDQPPLPTGFDERRRERALLQSISGKKWVTDHARTGYCLMQPELAEFCERVGFGKKGEGSTFEFTPAFADLVRKRIDAFDLEFGREKRPLSGKAKTDACRVEAKCAYFERLARALGAIVD